jgi:hypothetical protein
VLLFSFCGGELGRDLGGFSVVEAASPPNPNEQPKNKLPQDTAKSGEAKAKKKAAERTRQTERQGAV